MFPFGSNTIMFRDSPVPEVRGANSTSKPAACSLRPSGSFTLMNEMRHPRSAHRDTPPCRAGSSGAKAAPASRIEARRPEALLGTLAHATPSAFYVNLQMFMPIALHRCAMFAQASLAFR